MVKKDWETTLLLLQKLSQATEVVSQSFFTTAYLQQDSLLCFHPFLVSVLFSGPSRLALNFDIKFFNLSEKVL